MSNPMSNPIFRPKPNPQQPERAVSPTASTPTTRAVFGYMREDYSLALVLYIDIEYLKNLVRLAEGGDLSLLGSNRETGEPEPTLKLKGSLKVSDGTNYTHRGTIYCEKDLSRSQNL